MFWSEKKRPSNSSSRRKHDCMTFSWPSASDHMTEWFPLTSKAWSAPSPPGAPRPKEPSPCSRGFWVLAVLWGSGLPVSPRFWLPWTPAACCGRTPSIRPEWGVWTQRGKSSNPWTERKPPTCRLLFEEAPHLVGLVRERRGGSGGAVLPECRSSRSVREVCESGLTGKPLTPYGKKHWILHTVYTVLFYFLFIIF